MTWGSGKVTAAPSTQAVDLTTAKAHLRVSGSSEDTVIDAYRLAAIKHVENYTGLALAAQTVAFETSSWSDLAHLPIAPVTSLTISYRDAAGSAQTLDSAVYAVSGIGTLTPSVSLAPNRNFPDTASRADAITASIVCGYSSAPAPIQAAILLLIGDWYANREDSQDRSLMAMPNGVAALLSNYRLFS